MKTRLLGSTAVLCAIVAASPAHADATVNRNRSEGDGAWAGFYLLDTTSCPSGIVTRVFVHSNTYTADWNGAPAESGTTTVTISVWNYCLNVEVRSIVGSTTQQELQVDPNLDAASLRSSITALDDATGTFVDVTLVLVWSGTGKIIRGRSDFIEHFENLTVVSKSSGTSRDAVALGSLTLNGVERELPPSLEGQVESNTRRETTIIRN